MEIDENGVVNPLRPPAVISDVLRKVRALPPLALTFMVLAGVVLAVTVVERHRLDLTLVGRAVTILFPTALLWRRRDAGSVTPNLLLGTVLLAVEQIAATINGFVSLVLPVDESFVDGTALDVRSLVVPVVLGGLTAAGWWLVASAVAGMRPSHGGLRMVAAVVATMSLAGGAANLALWILFSIGSSLAETTLVLVVTTAESLVVAYVGWVLVSRAGGLPRRSTVAAAAGVAIQVVGSLPVVLIAFAIQATRADDWIALQGVGLTVLSIASLLSPVLFAFALAAGLGDPPHATPIPRRPSLDGSPSPLR